VVESVIYGRDADKEMIFNWLTSETDNSRSAYNIRVFKYILHVSINNIMRSLLFIPKSTTKREISERKKKLLF